MGECSQLQSQSTLLLAVLQLYAQHLYMYNKYSCWLTHFPSPTQNTDNYNAYHSQNSQHQHCTKSQGSTQKSHYTYYNIIIEESLINMSQFQGMNVLAMLLCTCTNQIICCMIEPVLNSHQHYNVLQQPGIYIPMNKLTLTVLLWLT